MGFLQKIIRNDAMKTDPHEIYNWRVFALACSVSVNFFFQRQSCADEMTGLFWWHALRHGYWYHWRRNHYAEFQAVGITQHWTCSMWVRLT